MAEQQPDPEWMQLTLEILRAQGKRMDEITVAHEALRVAAAVMNPEPEPEPELQHMRTPLRCRIDSDPASMQALHELHGWVPGADSIRPHPDILEDKRIYQETTKQFYVSNVDCVLDLVFDCPTSYALPPSRRS